MNGKAEIISLNRRNCCSKAFHNIYLNQHLRLLAGRCEYLRAQDLFKLTGNTTQKSGRLPWKTLSEAPPIREIGTPAERRIAKYFTEHLSDLPFETAASVADRLDLSPMTVGRFLRALGYQGLDSVKVQIRDVGGVSATQMQASMSELQIDAADGKPLAVLVAEQIRRSHHIYHLTGQQHWSDAVAMIRAASEVFIATHVAGELRHAFQPAPDAGATACTRSTAAATVLPNSSRASAAKGALVIIDSQRFKKARLLARIARRATDTRSF